MFATTARFAWRTGMPLPDLRRQGAQAAQSGFYADGRLLLVLSIDRRPIMRLAPYVLSRNGFVSNELLRATITVTQFACTVPAGKHDPEADSTHGPQR